MARIRQRGAVAELSQAGMPPAGAKLEISGDVRQGAGMSSSAALEVALTAIIALSDEPAPPALEFARICSRIEANWVGAQTGLLDQLTSLLGQKDQTLFIDFRTLCRGADPRGARRPQDRGRRLRQSRALASSGYNQRRQECDEVCTRLGVTTLRDAQRERVASLPQGNCQMLWIGV
jgi:galactokinase